jgi:Ca2+-binding RTX toxin-like protein
VVLASAATNQGVDYRDAKAGSGAGGERRSQSPAQRRGMAAALRRMDLLALFEGRRRSRDDPQAFNGFTHGGRHLKRGHAGIDYMRTGVGTVTLDGSGGADTLAADAGPDKLIGASGNDKLFGGSGADRLLGNAGNDLIVDQKGPAVIDTGAGSNVVDVRGHRGHDTIACTGSKRDIVHAEPGDTVAPSCR